MIGMIGVLMIIVNIWYLLESYSILKILAEHGCKIRDHYIEGNMKSRQDRSALLKLYLGLANSVPSGPNLRSDVFRIRVILIISTSLFCGLMYCVMTDPSRASFLKF
jgi:hypothetical protein